MNAIKKSVHRMGDRLRDVGQSRAARQPERDQGYQAQIDGDPGKFGEIALAHSDCSSHAKNGDLGFFGPGQMQKAFEEGAYALQVGQISDIVSSDSGVHLILRTA